jgi:NitT/TauT family transport system substrate-binding protein
LTTALGEDQVSRLPRMLSAIVAAGVLAGCSAAAPASAPNPTGISVAAAEATAAKPGGTLSLRKLRVGTSSLAGEAGTFLAMDKGYLRDEGIDVEIVGGISGSPNAIAAIAGGNLDIVTSGFDPPVLNGAASGVLRIVAPLSTADPRDRSSSLVVRQEHLDRGRYRSPADLKGMTVVAGPVPNFSSGFTVDRYLNKGGLKLSDVTLEYLGFPDALSALASKRVDAAFEVEPFATAAEAQGIAAPVIFSGEVVPRRDLFFYLVSPAFASANSDVLKRFFTAWLRGQRDYYNAFQKDQGGQAARDDVLRSLADHTQVKDIKTWQDLANKGRLHFVEPNGEFHPQDNQEIADFYLRVGSLGAKIDVANIVDSTFIEAAVQRLGRI